MKDKEKQHFMIREIKEQPTILRQMLDHYLDNEKKQIRKLDGLAPHLEKIKRLTFLGNGSSGYAAILGNYIFEEIVGLPCEYEFADEFITRKKVIEPGTAIVAISQSGETADIIEAAIQAKEGEAVVIGVTNNADSELAGQSDFVLRTVAGKEVAIASTKTFSTQILAMVIMAIFFADKKDKKISDRLIGELRNLPEHITQILRLVDRQIRNLAVKLKDKDDILVMGRKYNYPIALEGAQKLKETAYFHAEGFAAEEFRHGPKAIIEAGYPVIVLMPVDSVYAGNKSLVNQLKKAGAFVVTITNNHDVELETTTDMSIEIPETLEMLYPFQMGIPLQLLAYYAALEKGIDPDNPRNIEKYIK